MLRCHACEERESGMGADSLGQELAGGLSSSSLFQAAGSCVSYSLI